MRRSVAVLAAVMIVVALMLAPHTHLHVAEILRGHSQLSSGVIHAHAPVEKVAAGHADPAFQASDDHHKARQLTVFQASMQAAPNATALPNAQPLFMLSLISTATVIAPVERSHSPPDIQTVTPRSPPA